MSMQVLAKAKVLDTPIDAVFQKEDDKSIMLVYGHAENPKKVTLKELVEGLAEMVSFGKLDATKISAALPEAIGEGVKVSLNHVYFLKEGTKEGKADKDKKGSEYAFWIDFDIKDLTEGFPIEVESISLKFWSTASNKILEEMKINEINQLLESAGITPVALPASNA